jgi:hypothetical protein
MYLYLHIGVQSRVLLFDLGKTAGYPVGLLSNLTALDRVYIFLYAGKVLMSKRPLTVPAEEQHQHQRQSRQR